MNSEQALKEYLDALENLSLETLPDLKKHYTNDTLFKDPFFEVRGGENIEKAFAGMWKFLKDPHYKFHSHAWGEDNKTVMVRWSFLFLDKGIQQDVPGMGEIVISEDGKIISHIDFWDASEHVYEKIPVLGWIIKAIKRHIQKA